MDTNRIIQSVYSKLVSAVPLPLAETEEDIVPGEGTLEAKIMLIGEAPGYYESVERRPFVGKSGKLLRKTLTEVGLEPATVYISNIVKARPPDNRDPSTTEIAAYKPFLDEEIKVLQPEIIITLGRFSMQKFLPDVKISQVHGRLHKVKWNGVHIFILPMYHPAAALRAGAVLTAFVEDFKKVPKILDWIETKKEDTSLLAAAEGILT